MEKDADICSKLRELRRARGLTVDILAKKIGENSQKVGRIERGTRNLTLDYLVKVSKALETPLEVFLESEANIKEKKLSSKTNYLNHTVILVEEYAERRKLLPVKKALLISIIYESILKIPDESKELFLQTITEIMDSLDT